MKIEVRTDGFTFTDAELHLLREYNLVKQENGTFHTDLKESTGLYKAITGMNYNNRLQLAMVDGVRGCLMLVSKKTNN